jgi:uncharacterized Zn-binding protein involved in type VI secretion
VAAGPRATTCESSTTPGPSAAAQPELRGKASPPVRFAGQAVARVGDRLAESIVSRRADPPARGAIRRGR